MKDFYYLRWKPYLDTLSEVSGEEKIDWYAFEVHWTLQRNVYPSESTGNAVDVAIEVYTKVFKE